MTEEDEKVEECLFSQIPNRTSQSQHKGEQERKHLRWRVYGYQKKSRCNLARIIQVTHNSRANIVTKDTFSVK